MFFQTTCKWHLPRHNATKLNSVSVMLIHVKFPRKQLLQWWQFFCLFGHPWRDILIFHWNIVLKEVYQMVFITTVPYPQSKTVIAVSVGMSLTWTFVGVPTTNQTPLLQQLVMGLLMSFIGVITTRKSITIPAEVHESLKIVHTTKDYHHYTSYLHGAKHGSWQKCVSLCGSTLLYDS